MTNPNAAFGMFTIAGSVANPNGFDGGMITAILNTNGGTIPDNCELRRLETQRGTAEPPRSDEM
jgi:hypothetical protein